MFFAIPVANTAYREILYLCQSIQSTITLSETKSLVALHALDVRPVRSFSIMLLFCAKIFWANYTIDIILVFKFSFHPVFSLQEDIALILLTLQISDISFRVYNTVHRSVFVFRSHRLKGLKLSAIAFCSWLWGIFIVLFTYKMFLSTPTFIGPDCKHTKFCFNTLLVMLLFSATINTCFLHILMSNLCHKITKSSISIL